MIGRLAGKIAEKSPDGVLIDVGGVGYEVSLPLSTLAAMPPTGETAVLFIHTYVREDELRLFGFASQRDRTAFRTMLKVRGVGPKLAIAILGALSGGQLAEAVGRGDVARLSSIPGIGKKTAERLILELGGKLELGAAAGEGAAPAGYSELASALKNLGFKPVHVEQALADLRHEVGGDQPFELLLRRALSLLEGK